MRTGTLAAELTTLLRGKSTSAPTPNGAVRVDYGAIGNTLVAYIAGRSDTGTWRVEDGRICFEFKTWPSACNEARLVGSDIYTKRANGDVVPVTVSR